MSGTEPGATSIAPRVDRHVFVDEGGRRGRWAVRVGRIVIVGCFLYIGLVLASFVGAPWVPDLDLPSVGPAPAASTPRSPVTLPSTAATQPAPIARPTTATTSATSTSLPSANRPTNPHPSVPTTAATTSSTIVQGRRPSTSSTSSTTTSVPGHSGSAPGRNRGG